MKHKNTLFLLFLALTISLISCAPTMQQEEQAFQLWIKQKRQAVLSQFKWDTLYATYPRYLIDPSIRKICNIGSGEGKDTISAELAKRFTRWMSPPVKVIEQGNLEAVLKGKIIEYGTGLTKDESQAISQMFQVDHLLYFDEKISSRQSYMYGGRLEVRINLKIVETMSGEIVFQSSQNFGAFLPDPRPSYANYGHMEQTKTFMRMNCIGMLGYELLYACGNAASGYLYKKWPSLEPPIVGKVVIGSPAHEAGFQEGDNIIEINGNKIRNTHDVDKLVFTAPLKQGGSARYKLERNGKTIEVEVKYPLIPKPPKQKRYEKIDRERKPIGPRI